MDNKHGKKSGPDSAYNVVSRRKILKDGLAISVAASGFNCMQTWPARAAQARTLSSGYIPILDSVPLIVAYEKGFFKDNGIRADKPVLIRSWPALLEAFTARQILLTHILLPQVIVLRYGQNIPLRSVAFNHIDCVAMLRAKHIAQTKDLAGKVVACPTWWSPHSGLFQDLLRKNGLTPVVGKLESELAPNEVAFRVVPPPDMVEALKTGRIAGCVVSEPFGAAAEMLADATLIKMGGDVWQDHPCCQSVLLQSTIDQDRSWAQALTNAIYQGALWAHSNRAELAHTLGKDGGGYFPMPIKVIERALLKDDLQTYGPDGTGAIMHTHWGVKRADFRPYPYPSAFDVTLDLMKRTVVDESTPLPPQLHKLTGRQIANELVEYDLALKAYESVHGPEILAHNDKKPFERKEHYEVLVKS